jgi:hypothetical protein
MRPEIVYNCGVWLHLRPAGPRVRGRAGSTRALATLFSLVILQAVLSLIRTPPLLGGHWVCSKPPAAGNLMMHNQG